MHELMYVLAQSPWLEVWGRLKVSAAVLLVLVVVGLLFVILAMVLAARPRHFTRIERGNTVFISKGDDMKAIWPNVGGYRMSTDEDLDGRHWLVRVDPVKKVRNTTTGQEDEEPKKEKEIRNEILKSFFYGSLPGTTWLQRQLWNGFGIRFVSIWWPNTRVHEFEISRKRLKEGADVEAGASLKSRIVKSPLPPSVRSLLFLVPRPLYLEGVELSGDNAKLNLLVLAVFQQVIPALPVYYLKGDFFPLLDAAIEAALVDFFATHQVGVGKEGQFLDDEVDPGKAEEAKKKAEEAKKKAEGAGDKEVEYQGNFLTYAHWLKLKKAGGSPIEAHFRQLNASSEYYNSLEAKSELQKHLERLTGGKPGPTKGKTKGKKTARQIPHGIIPRFGFALVSFRLVDWEPHLSTQELAKALLAKETEKHLADGIRQKASGEGDAFRSRGSGEAERYVNLLQALIDKGVKPDVAAEVIRTQVEMEQLHGAGVTTYVRGQAGVMVPASMGSSAPPTPPAE